MDDKRDKPSKFEWEEGDLLLLDENQEEENQEESDKDGEEGS
ncbi:hypothetical protein [Listeria monocytogenes]|nr:hypothetical protein [Listeria monocytogenes]